MSPVAPGYDATPRSLWLPCAPSPSLRIWLQVTLDIDSLLILALWVPRGKSPVKLPSPFIHFVKALAAVVTNQIRAC
jgi:hypothetical protein